MLCKVCNRPLNESQFNSKKTFKSCPKCSIENGEEHVYYDYPIAFGTTRKRISHKNPDGPQSYCIPCRGNQKSTLRKYLCSELR